MCSKLQYGAGYVINEFHQTRSPRQSRREDMLRHVLIWTILELISVFAVGWDKGSLTPLVVRLGYSCLYPRNGPVTKQATESR